MTMRRMMGGTLVGVLLSVGLAQTSFSVEWYNLPFLSDVSASTVSGTAVTKGMATGGGVEVKLAGLRFLDKQNNRVKDLVAEVDKDVPAIPLQVRMRRCVRDVKGIPGQDMAWLDVRDPAEKGALLFEGWMSSLYPDVSTLENPRYDVRLMGCARPKGSAKPTVTAPSVRVEGGGVDDEVPAEVTTVSGTAAVAPADDEAPVSAEDKGPSEASSTGETKISDPDPYYVQGVEKQAKKPAADREPPQDQQDLQKMMDEGTY